MKCPTSRRTIKTNVGESVITILSNKFADGETLDLEGIIYLIDCAKLGKFVLLLKDEKKT